MGEKPRFEIIEGLPEVERKKPHSGKYADVLEEWLGTDAKTVRFICQDRRERVNIMTCCNNYRKKHHSNFVVWGDARTYDVYCVKG